MFGWKFWLILDRKADSFGWICFEYKNKPHFFSGCSVTHLIFTSFQLFLALTWSLKVDPFLLTSLRKSWQYPQCQAIEVQRKTGVWNISVYCVVLLCAVRSGVSQVQRSRDESTIVQGHRLGEFADYDIIFRWPLKITKIQL